jgi:parallel beta-helix repeat protein
VPTLTEALQDSAEYGDTVLVAPGTYSPATGETFPLFMVNGAALISEANAEETIVDAQGTAGVLQGTQLDSTTLVSGFTLTGGSQATGGGIYFMSSYATISDNIITGNVATGGTGRGGGIYCSAGRPLILNNQISHNSCPDWMGGGICLHWSEAIIQGNRVVFNTARYGGGIFNDDYCRGVIAGNFVARNHATATGGGVDCYMNSFPTVERNVIVFNTAADNGAGIACCYSSYPTITGNVVASNFGNYGGGIRTLGNSEPTISGNLIVDNIDGIYLTTTSGALSATDNNIYFNSYFDGDCDVINFTSLTLDLTSNFWWTTDSASISSLIDGPGEFVPFRTEPNEDAPFEPSQVTSVTAMADSGCTTPLQENLDVGDTLYVEIEGIDWNGDFRELAVAILRTVQDPVGILVPLIETDTASGIYQGRAFIGTYSDDYADQIGANSEDTLLILANIDPTMRDTVLIGPEGVQEPGSAPLFAGGSLWVSLSNPSTIPVIVRYGLPTRSRVNLSVYDASGALVEQLIYGEKPGGTHSASWSGARTGGIYFVRLETSFSHETRRVLIVP